MSYPPDRYHGDTGEASARVRRADATPELFNSTGSASYLATGASTNGQFGLYRWDMDGPPTGPGPHFHRSLSESFFVLSGAMRLYDGKAWTDAGPGDFMFVPEGGVHGFRNDSGEPASMLILFAPGAPREGYFEGLAGLAGKSEEERATFMTFHDTYWV
jgi:mannose-6-phosphate isomerase-like protein (cupin superfamily)